MRDPDRFDVHPTATLALVADRRPSGVGIVEVRSVGRASSRRRVDRLVAGAALCVLVPLLLAIAVAILLTSRGPVLFRQQRVGRHGEAFECLKFRTMRSGSEELLIDLLEDDPVLRAEWEADHKLRVDPRVTRVGRLLRLTNLDELPQFVNIVRGEMALVGPRPIVAAEAPRYGEALPTVLSVPPGLTGLWQVSGRNRLPYAERVRLDLHYVAHRSLRTDLGILARTPFAFGPRSGAR